MDEGDFSRIEQHYTNLTDDRLQSAYDAGPDGYTNSDVWQVIATEYDKRVALLAAAHAAAGTGESGPTRLYERPATRWFLASRILGKPSWDPSVPLPVNFFHFTIAMSVVASLLLLLDGIRGGGAGSLMLGALQAITVVVLLFAVDRTKPWGWYYIAAYYAVNLAFAVLNRLTAVYTPYPLWQMLVVGAYALLIGLYVARRRPQFGLPGWEPVR